MRQLDIAVAGALGLAQRQDEGLVADPVELACDGFETDVGHGGLLIVRLASLCLRFRRMRSAGWKRASRRRRPGRGIPVGRHPARPAEIAGLAEPHGLDLADRQRQLDIPFELLAEMEEDRVRQRFATVAIGQEAAELLHVARDDADAELVLDAVDAGPEQGVAAERAMAAAEPRAIGRVEHQPHADELLDLDLRRRTGPRAARAAARPTWPARRSARHRRAFRGPAPCRGCG